MTLTDPESVPETPTGVACDGCHKNLAEALQSVPNMAMTVTKMTSERTQAYGRVIRTLNKMMKNNAGYDWTQMFIGSEGTLGVITRVVLGLDRASMAYSVEARVPFLDHELVEYCARIPPRVKMKWLREKHVLRRAMESVLPPDIVNRKKRGLQVPMDAWLRAPLPEECVSGSSSLIAISRCRN